MNDREVFLDRWEKEQPIFVRVLRALPPDQLAYKPHERSTSAGDLAWQMAEEQRILVGLLTNGDIDFTPQPRPESLDEIVAAYEQHTNALRVQLKQADDAVFDREARFLMGGNVAGKGTVRNYLWGFLLDLVHHRGQLSAYIRPMGGKVPSIYGPSADSGH